MKAERIELPKTLDEKTAKIFIGKLGSVCTGKIYNIDEKYERIGNINLFEHLGGATKCWQFLPIYFEGIIQHYQNFRMFLNKKYSLVDICELYNNYENMMRRKPYHLFKISVPKYVAAHLKTHDTLTSIMSSARIGIDKEKLYEFPKIEKNETTITDVLKTTRDINKNKMKNYFENNNGVYFYNNLTGFEFEYALKGYYNRKEITKRSLSDFEVVNMVIGGYFNEGWDNFIKVRTASCDGTFICPNPNCKKPCIQKETRELANMIKKLIGLNE